MSMYQHKLAVATASCLLLSGAYGAEIQWSGFASVVAGKTLNIGETYGVGFAGYEATYENELSFEPDSIFGLQGQMEISDKLKATVQFVARGGDRHNAAMEWAYLSYQASEHVTVNAGRFRVPLYYYSDFLDVGYAYYWIRPPAEVYVGPSSLDGVNVYYANIYQDWEFSSQYWYATGDFADGTTTVNLSKNQGLNVSVGRDWWKVRGVYHTTDINMVLGDGTDIGSFDLSYWGVGFIGDYENLMIRSEYTELKFGDDGDFVPTWYASVGYVIGEYTPHITYTDDDGDNAKIMTYGVAWNFHPNTVFKMEYQDKDADSGDAKLLVAGIDVIF